MKNHKYNPDFKVEYGGSTAQNRRKTARPFDVNQCQHLVFKSEKLKLIKNPHCVEDLMRKLGSKWNILFHVYAFGGNHIHVLVSTSEQTHFQNFLREFGSQAPLLAGHKSGKFWSEMVYSKIVKYGSQFRNVVKYIIKNRYEFIGAIGMCYRKTNMPKFMKNLVDAGYEMWKRGENSYASKWFANSFIEQAYLSDPTVINSR